MLGKHILGYFPSLVVPAIASFGAVFAYTRLLTPHEYGHYALALNSMTLLNAVFFYWLQVSLPRLMPQAIKEGTAAIQRATTYAAFGASTIALIAVSAAFIAIVPLGDLSEVAWFAVPLALVRSLLNMNQAFHRSALNFKRYNIIECGQAILGLAFGLALIYCLHMDELGAVLGLLLGLTCMILVDLRDILRTSLADFSPVVLREIARFGLPLVFSFGLMFIISTSDRFLIEHFRGAAEVGIYAAGYSLMDRIGQILFMVVAVPSFPLTIHRLEHEGVEAAQAQTYDNGVATLSLVLPACAGLILCNGQLATVLIGEEFRAGALNVMPWIVFSMFLNGLATHYFDHAFHLAKKPMLFFVTQGPIAALNLTLNLIWIPRYGYMGAAYSALISYTLRLVLSIVVGRRVFKIRFPFKPALQITAATALMALALRLPPFPPNIFGLAAMVVLGGTVYAIALLAFNVANMRKRALRLLRR